MKSYPNDLQAILRRIEKLERQNRRWKVAAATGLVLLTVGVLAAFQASGQQQHKVASLSVPDPMNTTVAGYGPIAEKCNAATSADYEANCMVGAMLALPNTQVKLNFLATVVDDLWLARKADWDFRNHEYNYLNEQLDRQAGIADKNLAGVVDKLNEIGQLATDNYNKILTLSNGKSELDDFENAACPVLRRAAQPPKRSWTDAAGRTEDDDIQRKVESACYLH